MQNSSKDVVLAIYVIAINAAWWLKFCQLLAQAVQILDGDEYVMVVGGQFKSGSPWKSSSEW